MDGKPSTQTTTLVPTPLRIETGDQPAMVQPAPHAWPHWAAPTIAGGAVFLGLTVAALGVLWLRQRPSHEPAPDELFEQVAKALGLSPQTRQSILTASAKAAQPGADSNPPSPTGRAMWA